MLEKLFATESNILFTIARITLGIVMLPHGLQKLVGWFGGYGFSATMSFFVSKGFPVWISFLIIIAESLGAMGLIFGLFTRVSAFGIGFVMIGAAIYQKEYGFFMNWFGNQQGEGFEYHLLAIGLAVLIFIAGGGSFSLDQLFFRKLK